MLHYNNMEHIIAYENKPEVSGILRKLSMFDENVQKDPKKGLALCHGHNHSIRPLAEVEFIEYWYLVDKYQESYPDYIADATDSNKMAYFPDNYFDCVLTVYCPTLNKNDVEQYTAILKNIHRIIKKDGILGATELPDLFYNLVDKEQFDHLVEEIKRIVPKEEIEKFKSNYIKGNEELIQHALLQIKERLISDPNLDENMKRIRDELKTEEGFNKHKQEWIKRTATDREIYREIATNYRGPNSEILHQKLKELSIPATKKILEDNGFRFKEIKDKFLFAEPINK